MICRTQAEIDAAIKAGHLIEIDDTWTESSRAVLRGSSSAVLWGSSSAVLRDSSSAVLRESSSAVLRDSSSAVLRESSSAVLRESSRAVLRESSSAVLWESSRAVLWGSSSAVLWESSSAVLWESSRAELRGKRTGARLIGDRPTASGPGQAYRVRTVEEWADYEGAAVEDEHVTLYKALTHDLTGGGGYPTRYEVGTAVVADDWDPNPDRQCGGGLHLCADPRTAIGYCDSATTVVECRVALLDVVVFEPDLSKVRCRQVEVVRVSHTVDAQGWPVEVEAVRS